MSDQCDLDGVAQDSGNASRRRSTSQANCDAPPPRAPRDAEDIRPPRSSATEVARRECTLTSSTWQPGNIGRRLVAGFQRPPPPPPGDQAQETTLYLGMLRKCRCHFARQPTRPPLVELLYPPLAALRLARHVVSARQSWSRHVLASFIDSTALLSLNACSAAAAAAAALRDPASSSIELPEPADVVVLSVSDAPRI
jgi:hypothetical protein